MTQDIIIDLFRYALMTIIISVAIIVLPGLVFGLMISIFQAATQINEQTLSFIPRLLVTLGALAFLGPWLLRQLVNFAENLINNISSYVF